MSEIRKLLGIIVILILLSLAYGITAPAAAAGISSNRTVFENLVAVSSFSTTTGALREAGIDVTLNSPGPYTLFAPVDDAFSRIPKNDRDALLQNRTALGKVLKYHLVPEKLTFAELSKMTEVKTVEGNTLPIGMKEGALTVGGVKVKAQGLDCRNGIIFPVDGVAMPPGISAAQISRSTDVPLSLLGWALGALIIGGLVVYLIPGLLGRKRVDTTRSTGPVTGQTYQEYERRTGVQEPAVPRVVPDNAVLDRSAVDALKGYDRNRLARIQKHLIGSPENYVGDLAGFTGDVRISYEEIRNRDAARSLKERYSLTPFDANALELALEHNAILYTADPALRSKYLEAGARSEDIGELMDTLA